MIFNPDYSPIIYIGQISIPDFRHFACKLATFRPYVSLGYSIPCITTR